MKKQILLKRRQFSIALVLALLPVGTHANDGRLPLRKIPVAVACVRYLARAVARSFTPAAILTKSVVSTIKIDPRTVHSRTKAISTAVDQIIRSMKIAAAKPEVLGLIDPIPSQMHRVVAMPLEEHQKSALRELIDIRRAVYRDEIRKIEGSVGTPGSENQQSRLADYRNRLAWIANSEARIDSPPAKNTDNVPDEDPLEVEAGIQNEIFNLTDRWTRNLFGRNSPVTKVVRDTGELVVATESDISGANSQIVVYFVKKLLSDSIAYSDALEFYSRLQNLDQSQTDATRGLFAEIFDPPTTINIWTVALDATGGDVSRALRAISIYGHDDTAQSLGQLNPYLELIDLLLPHISSLLYRNGAVDGLQISAKLRERFKTLETAANAFNERYAGDSVEKINLEAVFRTGNYHFIGGALMVNELLSMGNDHFLGMNLPVIIAEVAGKAYKRITMEQAYMSKNEQILYKRGFPTIPVLKPSGWSQAEYERAKIGVRLQLAHLDLTHEQHLKGAHWAYEQLRSNGLTRYKSTDFIP